MRQAFTATQECSVAGQQRARKSFIALPNVSLP